MTQVTQAATLPEWKLSPGAPRGTHRTAHPGAWTRWRHNGGELQLQRKDGWKKLAFQKTYPHLPAGLQQRAGSGRSPGRAASRPVGPTSEYTFSRDSSRWCGAAAPAAAPSRAGPRSPPPVRRPGRRGRYQVDGLALEIAWEGGGGERRILVTDPADPKGAMWLDGQAYVQR